MSSATPHPRRGPLFSTAPSHRTTLTRRQHPASQTASESAGTDHPRRRGQQELRPRQAGMAEVADVMSVLTRKAMRDRVDDTTHRLLGLFDDDEPLQLSNDVLLTRMDRSSIAGRFNGRSYALETDESVGLGSSAPWEFFLDTTRQGHLGSTLIESDYPVGNSDRPPTYIKGDLRLWPYLKQSVGWNDFPSEALSEFGEFVANGGDPATLRMRLKDFAVDTTRHDRLELGKAFGANESRRGKWKVDTRKEGEALVSTASEKLGTATVSLIWGGRGVPTAYGVRREVDVKLHFHPIEQKRSERRRESSKGCCIL